LSHLTAKSTPVVLSLHAYFVLFLVLFNWEGLPTTSKQWVKAELLEDLLSQQLIMSPKS
jgi:hypothetical protein